MDRKLDMHWEQDTASKWLIHLQITEERVASSVGRIAKVLFQTLCVSCHPKHFRNIFSEINDALENTEKKNNKKKIEDQRIDFNGKIKNH